jgi:hypothetical protein
VSLAPFAPRQAQGRILHGNIFEFYATTPKKLKPFPKNVICGIFVFKDKKGVICVECCGSAAALGCKASKIKISQLP